MRRLTVFALFAGLALACASSPSPSGTTTSATLDDAFTSAATESGAPRDLLVAIARVEGGLEMPKTRVVNADAHVPVAGPLQLRRGKLDTLALGAKLLGVSEVDIRTDSDLGLRAGALVVAELGKRTGARPNDLASWEKALEDLSGYADQHHRAMYAHRVFEALGAGGTFEARGGEKLTLVPNVRALEVDVTIPEQTFSTMPEFAGAEVFVTDCNNKCDTTRDGNSVDYVVIHDTEGGWDASVATLQNDPGKSVQYIVGTDGAVGQFVPESYTAWHAGNYWYNQRSVGIEHCMELVVQRARALHHGHVLGDARKAVAVIGVLEALGKPRGEVGNVGAEHGDQASVEERLQHFVEVVLRRWRRIWRIEAGLLSENRAV